MSDKFDFEQQIMSCWNIVEDIDTVVTLTNTRSTDVDELKNILAGLKALYQVKFEILFDQFEALVHNGKIT